MMTASLEPRSAHDDTHFDAANDIHDHDDVANGAKTTEAASQMSTPNAVNPFDSSPADRQQKDDQHKLRLVNKDRDCNQSQQRRPVAIDSALRSALSDPRERLALLRCEQQFVLFMHASNVAEITVGGAYNSVVVGLANVPAINSDAGLGTYNNNGSRSTSFQRCWLHRLADRFGIVRETVNSEWIRCKKTPDSAIPTLLLSQLGPDSYYSNSNESDQTATRSMSQLSLGASPAVGSKGAFSTNTKAGVPRRSNKMKIMKRDSSSSLGASSIDGKRGNGSSRAALSDSDKSHLKRGTLPEKEKAYAEARARIFNEGAAAASAATNEHSLEPSMMACVGDLPKSSSYHSLPSTSSTADQENFDQNEPPHQRPRPAAAAIGGISKVTWRNRQQEVNDPDFQRGVMYNNAAVVPDVSYYYTASTGGQLHVPNSYYYQHAQYQHQERQQSQMLHHSDHHNINAYSSQQQQQPDQYQQQYMFVGQEQRTTTGQPSPSSGVQEGCHGI